MAPTRTTKSFKKRKFNKNDTEVSTNATAGVQNIKAALRQTRRLLAKDKLAADTRVETERRLKSLGADLVQAETRKKERTFAVRYHMVKFFERKKVLRKIKQAKKEIEQNKEQKKLDKIEEKLSGLRVDLNYILHYPKTKPYISLFPPESEPQDEQPEHENDTDAQREEVRQWIRERMEKDEISKQPELERERKEVKSTFGGNSQDKQKPRGKRKEPEDEGMEQEKDAFFASDDDEDEDEEL